MVVLRVKQKIVWNNLKTLTLFCSTLGFTLNSSNKSDFLPLMRTGYEYIVTTLEFKEGDQPLGSSLIEVCDAANNEGFSYTACDVNGQGFWFRQHLRINSQAVLLCEQSNTAYIFWLCQIK